MIGIPALSLSPQIRPCEPARLALGCGGCWTCLPRRRTLPTTNRRLPEAESEILWVEQSQAVMVAHSMAMERWWGSYYLKPNALCLGAHVAQCRLCGWQGMPG